MATSFIDFNGKGFWIRDNILTLTLCFLHTKMSERDLPLWAVEFRRLIKENAIGNFYGFVDVELDKCLINVERRRGLLRQFSPYKKVLVIQILLSFTMELSNLLKLQMLILILAEL